jgi:hypothetical protein
VSGRIPHSPPRDRVRDVVAVSDHHVFGVKARVLPVSLPGEL